MNWKKIIGIIVAIVIAALFVFKLRTNKNIAEERVYQYDKEQAINVQVDTLQLEIINAEYSYTGTFQPNKETKISAELQGKINTILVDAGSVVSKGQPLILLDNSLLKLQLQTIEVQIEGLEADVNRYTILAEADAIQGVQLEKAELGLKSAKVQKATLLEQISKTTIRAPFSGVVTAKLSEEGAFAAPGVPLLQITDITTLKFTINVPEKDLSQFKLNQTLPLSADAYSEIILTGKTTMIGSKANMGSSFPVQFMVKNTSDLKIKSGMFGKVLVKSETSGKGIIIPSSAIKGTENQPQVYVVKNGKALLQGITISKKIQNKAVVSNGLNEGDVIVTNGLINLFDGADVTVK
ncbi:efflux RND transporter periplasmic adaptor subunit [Psychroserpens mesophilus]|uniref:efflux RND transporter periplasmic adaptor subunit n=1 Tax=Psychroserpens mesophilus TaxID=325473 RepID=UPI00059030C9|nr:efflux RND transporter periplasmic adaptor subunit [Psychroserpens mesophilus]